MAQTSQIVIQTLGCGVSTIECGCGLVLQRHYYWKDYMERSKSTANYRHQEQRLSYKDKHSNNLQQ
jgi:hypothetical protein